MENSGGESQVADDGAVSASPPALLDLMVARLAEPAALLDESLTIVSANDAFAALAGEERTPVGEGFTAAVPVVPADAVADSVDAAGEYVTVRTGDDRWTEFGFDRHGSHVLCVGRDVGPDRDAVGNRRAPAETLVSLQTATRDLLAAETSEAVAERIVATATGVLGLSGATLYLFDACRNVLWPAGVAGAAGEDARRAVGGDDDGVVRAVFLEGAETTVAGGDRYRPLGDHGVLHTVSGDDAAPERGEASDERTRALGDRLAESARNALDRVDRETTLRKRDASHRAQAERTAELERRLSLVRRVTRALVDADSVAEIERKVTEALSASSWLSFAWVGRADSDGVEPRGWAGRGSDYLEAVSLSTDTADAPPAVRAARSNEPVTVGAIAEEIGDHPWARAAIARDFQAAIAVQLRVDGVGFGVLTAYATGPIEWDEELTALFAGLGTRVAAAIRDRERQSRLAGDAGVELDLAVTAPDAPLVELAGTLGASVCCSEAISVDGTTTRLFVSVPGVEHEAVDEAVEAVRHVDSMVTLADGDRYELVLHEPTVVGRVLRHGGRLETACVTGGELTLTVALAADTDVRTFVDQLADGWGDVRLVARRRQSPGRRRAGGIREALDDELTDRQLEALRTAYSSGFFEWPRETTGEGVADMLGVAQPTVNRHLRVSQRKLLELVFDDR